METAPLSVVQMALHLEVSSDSKSAALLAEAMVSQSAIEMGSTSGPASDPSSDPPSALSSAQASEQTSQRESASM